MSVSKSDIHWPAILKQLSVMIDGGLAFDHALRTLAKGDGKNERALKKCLGLVEQGVGLSEALKRNNIISEFDYQLLRTAEDAGRVEAGLDHIAGRRIDQLQAIKSLQASLWLPKAILLIGAFAGLFIKLAVNGQTLENAVFEIGVVLLQFFVLSYVFIELLKADKRLWLSLFWPSSFIRSRVKLYQHNFEQAFYRSFIWQTESGIDAQSAVLRCRYLLSAKSFHQAVTKASNLMSNGLNIIDCLVRTELVLSKRMTDVLTVANNAGVFEKALSHELKIINARLKQQRDDFYKWIPRVYYLIALVVTSRLMA